MGGQRVRLDSRTQDAAGILGSFAGVLVMRRSPTPSHYFEPDQFWAGVHPDDPRVCQVAFRFNTEWYVFGLSRSLFEGLGHDIEQASKGLPPPVPKRKASKS
jgi:hypothetical protein